MDVLNVAELYALKWLECYLLYVSYHNKKLVSQYITKYYNPGLAAGISYLRTLEEKGGLAGEYVRRSNTLVNREMQIKQ